MIAMLIVKNHNAWSSLAMHFINAGKYTRALLASRPRAIYINMKTTEIKHHPRVSLSTITRNHRPTMMLRAWWAKLIVTISRQILSHHQKYKSGAYHRAFNNAGKCLFSPMPFNGNSCVNAAFWYSTKYKWRFCAAFIETITALESESIADIYRASPFHSRACVIKAMANRFEIFGTVYIVWASPPRRYQE